MAPPSLVAAGALALVACWGNTPTPTPVTPAPKPTPLVASRPRGIVLIAQVAVGSRVPILFWNDLDAGETGELKHNLTSLLPAITTARNDAWFSSDDEVLRVSRPAKGPGVLVDAMTTDRIWAVNRDATLAVIGCATGVPCHLGKLTATGVLDDKPIGTTLPYQHGIELAAWLTDGRLVYQEKGLTPAIWYVDPKTDHATGGLRLVAPFSAITDDGSLIAWHVELSHGKQVVRWKRVATEQEMSLEIAASTIDCRFTPVSRLLYCVAAPVGRKSIDDLIIRNRLLMIDPATGKSRELAGDLPLLDTHFTAASPDGRYIAYTAYEEETQRSTLVDLLSGETYPAGPSAAHVHVVGWMAPR